MKFIRCVVPVLVLIASSEAFAGEVFKCVDASGKVTFSDTSCPASEQQQTQGVKAAGQEAAKTRQEAPAQEGTPPRGTYGQFIDRSRQDIDKATKPPQ